MDLNRLAKAIVKTAKQGTPKSVAFEITKKCNLHCKHCYRRDFSGRDLSDKKWIEVFKNLDEEGYVQAGWVGGEPMLRKDLIAKGRRFFQVNAVVTNGTIPLPKWPDVLFGVSVDGNRKIYKEIRGEFIPNQYELVTNNILDGIKNGNKVFVLMTIHKINQGIIEEFVENWHKKNVTGVIFDFYTPQINESKNSIWLGWKERDKVIDRIMKLRKKYGKFLPWNPPSLMKKMKSDVCKRYTNNCPKTSMSPDKKKLKLNYKGNRLYPCIMGRENIKDSKIDCDRCGCIFAFPFGWQGYLTSIKTAFF
jgi:MoaA/NifB/PqqE/SkfB family radical SAM enzyme